MASKTALPIARLRSLGCKVGTVIGHDVPSPVSGRSPGVRAVWKYSITLPEGIQVPLEASKFNGAARADVDQRDRSRIIVTGLDKEQPKWRDGVHNEHLRRDSLTAKVEREQVEGNVAALLSSIADALTKKTASR